MNQQIYQDKQYQIVQHLHYIMKNVDGLVWLLQKENFGRTIDIIFRDTDERKMLDHGQITIAVAEAGLINTRKLYQFLGIKIHPKTQELTATTDGDRRYPEDVDITDLGLEKFSVSDLDILHSGDKTIHPAVTHTLLAASKGVAHFTVGGVEGARVDYTLTTAQVGLLLVHAFVLCKYPMLDYWVWTNNHLPGSALPPRHRS